MKYKSFIVRLSEAEIAEFEKARVIIEEKDGGIVSNPRVVSRCVKAFLRGQENTNG